MFSKSSPSPADEMSIPTGVASNSATFSVLGADVTVRGNIDATVDLHVDGCVEGDIRCITLIQGGNSTIKGGVSAEQARIAGTVEGSIAAKEIIIEASARVSGDVVYEKISVATGGHIDGSFKHKSPGTVRAEDAGLKLIETSPEPEPEMIDIQANAY
ncbi:MAG: polymer-forming cytoskeletal protein [Sphingomonadaceae bacterium]|nr:polymer-forming cytoskeletal protein [Sphingomonadaceae bacterium]